MASGSVPRAIPIRHSQSDRARDRTSFVRSPCSSGSRASCPPCGPRNRHQRNRKQRVSSTRCRVPGRFLNELKRQRLEANGIPARDSVFFSRSRVDQSRSPVPCVFLGMGIGIVPPALSGVRPPFFFAVAAARLLSSELSGLRPSVLLRCRRCAAPRRRLCFCAGGAKVKNRGKAAGEEGKKQSEVWRSASGSLSKRREPGFRSRSRPRGS